MELVDMMLLKSIAYAWEFKSPPDYNLKINSMANIKMTKDEQQWQAEEDARTIERYNEIINDKPRLDRAMKAAEKQVENLTERAKALNKSITGIKIKK